MTNQHGSGNSADDPKKASDAGRKGGQHTQQGSHSTSEKSGTHSGQQEQAGRSTGQQGGAGSSNEQHGSHSNFKDDPEKAREADHKGGQHSHGGTK